MLIGGVKGFELVLEWGDSGLEEVGLCGFTEQLFLKGVSEEGLVFGIGLLECGWLSGDWFEM